ncbi:hypothetical protein [Erythrobacter litoralis]|uniref:DUF3618 domain-containing protein n=1 Tax=Erythrobacter litoralis (strain HTCC2594) TaxID=314225 RepID=Q2NAQ5_ERYLH|nr:hypothetical protein [Erythrobacter litoralis]ABC63236.1 hypothetical protein ELI_05720 [Erythrobacter litoralis HTCC2594]
MKWYERELREDRRLRDAAKALLLADVERVKEDFSSRSLTHRAADRLQEGASEIFDQASEVAQDNKGVLAVLVGAVLLWFARNPIMSTLGFASDSEDAETEGDFPEPEQVSSR